METGEGEKYERGFCPAFTGVSPLAPLFFRSFFFPISGELSGLEWRAALIGCRMRHLCFCGRKTRTCIGLSVWACVVGKH